MMSQAVPGARYGRALGSIGCGENGEEDIHHYFRKPMSRSGSGLGTDEVCGSSAQGEPDFAIAVCIGGKQVAV